MVMIYPNRLAEIMDRHPMTGPELAAAAETTKQQIHKLRKGERKLTREWAERLAPHLGVTWPEVMGWPDSPMTPTAQRQVSALQYIGARIAWSREYRGLDLTEAANRFSMPPQRLFDIEAGTADLTALEAATISAKLQVKVAFLLMGELDDLPHKMAEQWEARQMGRKGQRPTGTG